MRYYAGIGSRETPPEIQNKMYLIAKGLGKLQFTVCTGGADGADKMFLQGAPLVRLFLPNIHFTEDTSSIGLRTDDHSPDYKALHTNYMFLDKAANRKISDDLVHNMFPPWGYVGGTFKYGTFGDKSELELLFLHYRWKKPNDEIMYLAKQVRIMRDTWHEDMISKAKAIKYHPGWHKLGQQAKNYHIRNISLMYNTGMEVEFVICYTPDGKASGGTGQAMRYAIDRKIPIYNLYHKKDEKALIQYIEDNRQLCLELR